MKNLKSINTVYAVGGALSMGFFLSFLIEVDYGLDAFTFMNLAVADKLHMSLGNWQLIFNLLLFAFVIWKTKLHYIGIGTLANMVLLGYVADFCRFLWARLLPSSLFTALPARPIVFVVALIGFVVSVAVYTNAGMGVAPFDATPMIISSWLPKVPFFAVRMVWDFSAIVIGLLAGGKLRPATLIMSVALGPVITMVGRLMRRGLKESETL